MQAIELFLASERPQPFWTHLSPIRQRYVTDWPVKTHSFGSQKFVSDMPNKTIQNNMFSSQKFNSNFGMPSDAVDSNFYGSQKFIVDESVIDAKNNDRSLSATEISAALSYSKVDLESFTSRSNGNENLFTAVLDSKPTSIAFHESSMADKDEKDSFENYCVQFEHDFKNDQIHLENIRLHTTMQEELLSSSDSEHSMESELEQPVITENIIKSNDPSSISEGNVCEDAIHNNNYGCIVTFESGSSSVDQLRSPEHSKIEGASRFKQNSSSIEDSNDMRSWSALEDALVSLHSNPHDNGNTIDNSDHLLNKLRNALLEMARSDFVGEKCVEKDEDRSIGSVDETVDNLSICHRDSSLHDVFSSINRKNNNITSSYQESCINFDEVNVSKDKKNIRLHLKKKNMDEMDLVYKNFEFDDSLCSGTDNQGFRLNIINSDSEATDHYKHDNNNLIFCESENSYLETNDSENNSSKNEIRKTFHHNDDNFRSLKTLKNRPNELTSHSSSNNPAMRAIMENNILSSEHTTVDQEFEFSNGNGFDGLDSSFRTKKGIKNVLNESVNESHYLEACSNNGNLKRLNENRVKSEETSLSPDSTCRTSISSEGNIEKSQNMSSSSEYSSVSEYKKKGFYKIHISPSDVSIISDSTRSSESSIISRCKHKTKACSRREKRKRENIKIKKVEPPHEKSSSRGDKLGRSCCGNGSCLKEKRYSKYKEVRKSSNNINYHFKEIKKFQKSTCTNKQIKSSPVLLARSKKIDNFQTIFQDTSNSENDSCKDVITNTLGVQTSTPNSFKSSKYKNRFGCNISTQTNKLLPNKCNRMLQDTDYSSNSQSNVLEYPSECEDLKRELSNLSNYHKKLGQLERNLETRPNRKSKSFLREFESLDEETSDSLHQLSDSLKYSKIANITSCSDQFEKLQTLKDNYEEPIIEDKSKSVINDLRRNEIGNYGNEDFYRYNERFSNGMNVIGRNRSDSVENIISPRKECLYNSKKFRPYTSSIVLDPVTDDIIEYFPPYRTNLRKCKSMFLNSSGYEQNIYDEMNNYDDTDLQKRLIYASQESLPITKCSKYSSLTKLPVANKFSSRVVSRLPRSSSCYISPSVDKCNSQTKVEFSGSCTSLGKYENKNFTVGSGLDSAHIRTSFEPLHLPKKYNALKSSLLSYGNPGKRYSAGYSCDSKYDETLPHGSVKDSLLNSRLTRDKLYQTKPISYHAIKDSINSLKSDIGKSMMTGDEYSAIDSRLSTISSVDGENDECSDVRSYPKINLSSRNKKYSENNSQLNSLRNRLYTLLDK